MLLVALRSCSTSKRRTWGVVAALGVSSDTRISVQPAAPCGSISTHSKVQITPTRWCCPS